MLTPSGPHGIGWFCSFGAPTGCIPPGGRHRCRWSDLRGPQASAIALMAASTPGMFRRRSRGRIMDYQKNAGVGRMHETRHRRTRAKERARAQCAPIPLIDRKKVRPARL
jgi:hypothetical protein